MNKTLFLKTGAIALLLNMVVSLVLTALASPEQKDTTADASELPFQSQLFRAAVGSSQVLVASSLLVALVAGCACLAACLYDDYAQAAPPSLSPQFDFPPAE